MSLKSIQELQQMIEALQRRVAELEGLQLRVEQLEHEVRQSKRANANRSGVRP